MGVLGDTAKGSLILTVVVGVFLIFEFIAINQIAIAILILVGLIIPLSLVALEYRKNFREFQCSKCKHNFKVSYLRLLFTLKFRGKDPTQQELQLTIWNARNAVTNLGLFLRDEKEKENLTTL